MSISNLRSAARPIPSRIRPTTAQMWQVLMRARVASVAWAEDEEATVPHLRRVHAVVLDGCLWWHAGMSGEKHGLVGRRGLLAVDEPLVTVPSTFVDPELACPATTYYRSVHVRGPVELETDPGQKARVLDALLGVFQAKAGHTPLQQDPALYAKPLQQIAVLKLTPETWVGRFKLGQRKAAARMTRVLEGLWRRGEDGDVRAMQAIAAAHPDTIWPVALHHDRWPFTVAPSPADADEVTALVRDSYWNSGVSPRKIAAAHRRSSAWILLRHQGRIIATARATGDQYRYAMVHDVFVAAEYRGRGLGQSMMRVLLDHPRVRSCDRIKLATQDAFGFYTPLGFQMDIDGRLMVRQGPKWP